MSDFLRLFMISFKYGLILSSILQLIVFYFYLHYFHIQYICYSKIFLLLVVYNNLQKVFNIANYYLIASFSFFSSKRFLISLNAFYLFLGESTTSICHFFRRSVRQSVAHHISGTVHHLIITFGTHM